MNDLESKIDKSHIRMPRTLRNTALTATLFLSSAMALAQSSLQGTVRSLDRSTGAPLSEVQVTVDDAYNTTTDANGNYSINNINTPSPHKIIVRTPGRLGVRKLNYAGSTFNVSLPLSAGIDLNIARQMHPTSDEFPNGYNWNQWPVLVFISGGSKDDTTKFKAAIAAGTGNWQDSQVGSVENKLQRSVRILTNDSVAAYNQGIVLKCNQGITASSIREYNNGLIRSVTSRIQAGSQIQDWQHEVFGISEDFGYTTVQGIMSVPPRLMTDLDVAIVTLGRNTFDAVQRGEMDAGMNDFDTYEALPIQLSDFNASSLLNVKTGHVVRLDWTTASETNNYGFNVQRSKDNKNYVTLENKFVKGNGTTLEQHKYNETDTTELDKPYYRLEQIDLDGTRNYTEGKQVITTDVNSDVPIKTALAQNYPNPFNPETTIEYQLQKAGKVKLSIYNALGQEVAKITDANMPAGKYSTKWNANGLSSGVYILRLEADEQNQTKKMMLVK